MEATNFAGALTIVCLSASLKTQRTGILCIGLKALRPRDIVHSHSRVNSDGSYRTRSPSVPIPNRPSSVPTFFSFLTSGFRLILAPR